MDAKTIAKVVGKALAQNKPSILTGAGVFCFIGASVATGFATVKAIKRVSDAKAKKQETAEDPEDFETPEEDEEDDLLQKVGKDYLDGMTKKQVAEKYDFSLDEVKEMIRAFKKKRRQPKPGELSKWEVFKAAAPVFVPAVLLLLAGVICIVTANKVHIDRTMAAVAACELSGNALKEYQEKTVEKFGEKADKEIKEEVAKDRIKKNPPENNTVIITGNGDFLCYEPISEQYFKSNTNAVRGAVFNIRDALADEGKCTMNDYLDWLKIDPMPYGDNIMWTASTPSETRIDFSPIYDRASPEDDTPCLIIELYPKPTNFGEKYKRY